MRTRARTLVLSDSEMLTTPVAHSFRSEWGASGACADRATDLPGLPRHRSATPRRSLTFCRGWAVALGQVQFTLGACTAAGLISKPWEVGGTNFAEDNLAWRAAERRGFGSARRRPESDPLNGATSGVTSAGRGHVSGDPRGCG